jgi:hypothetical protein
MSCALMHIASVDIASTAHWNQVEFQWAAVSVTDDLMALHFTS